MPASRAAASANLDIILKIQKTKYASEARSEANGSELEALQEFGFLQSPKHRTFTELRFSIFQNTKLVVEVLFQKEFGDPN